LKEIMAEKNTTDKISVLLVDDHSLVRRGFRRMLEDEEDIHVVGEASDGEEAVTLARSLKPQVVVMDCALPGISGLQATRKILQLAPETLILMLRMHAEETWVRQAMDAGARGYVLKNAMDLELGPAIRRMMKGETVLDGQLSRQGNLKGERNAGLTPREALVAATRAGVTNSAKFALSLGPIRDILAVQPR